MEARLARRWWLVVLAGSLCFAQSDDKQVVDSFKGYMQHHFDSYKTNRRERVTLLGGGWVKEYYEPDASSATFDVQRTSSLVSPYLGKLNFRLRAHYTAFHKTREEAAGDSNFTQVSSTLHMHTYAYQDGKWVPQARKHAGVPGTTEYACDEVVRVGPDAGQLDIYGCLEEYDEANKQ